MMETASNSGHVRVYQNNNGSWTQLGQDIDGENSGSQSGFSVSLSSEGNIVALDLQITMEMELIQVMFAFMRITTDPGLK